MQYQSHNKRFSERMELLDSDADDQLALELFELHETKCTTCQEDRLSCTFRPSCRDRNFLNLLIELHVDNEDLPSFCYSVYLEQVRRYILERKGRGMDNRRIPIEDLLRTLKMSSIKQFTTKFAEMWKKTARAGEQDMLLFLGDDLIFQFDFARALVIMNPVNYEIRDSSVFKLYSDLFSSYYGVESSLESIAVNWWALMTRATGATPADVRKRLNQKLIERFADVTVESMDGGVQILAEVVVEEGVPPVQVADLKHIFEIASGVPTRPRNE